MLVGITALMVVQAWLEIEIPRLMGEMTQTITAPTAYGIAMGDIWRTGGFMLLAAVGSLTCAILAVWLSTRMSARFAAGLRSEIFNRVEQFSATEINRFSIPGLITRTTNDVTRVQMFLGIGARLIIRAPVMAIWAFTRISMQNWRFVAVVGIAIVVMMLVVLSIVVFVIPKNKKIQELTDDLNRHTRESLMGIRVVRAYNAQSYQEQKFEASNSEMQKTQTFVERLMQLLTPGMLLIVSGLTLSITLITATLIRYVTDVAVQSEMVADMLTFSQYAIIAIMSFVMLVIVFTLLPRAAVSSKRILEVLDTPSSVVDGEGIDKRNEKQSGCVEFKNVSFSYDDSEENVLENISFKVNKGETIAFIGSTGSGKSTLINLIPRFYDATEGQILIGGEHIQDYKLDALNNLIGYVSQKGIIFSGTIRDNIALGEKGEKMTDADIHAAVSIAQASEVVASKEGGLDARTAQGGSNFSGGQKQRLSIARALAKKPEILIFDDSFSALDFKTDRSLRDALATHTQGVTKLIVAQRIGSIADADHIMVLDKGRVVGFGKHRELLQTCGVYVQIARSQLSKEELAEGGMVEYA